MAIAAICFTLFDGQSNHNFFRSKPKGHLLIDEYTSILRFEKVVAISFLSFASVIILSPSAITTISNYYLTRENRSDDTLAQQINRQRIVHLHVEVCVVVCMPVDIRGIANRIGVARYAGDAALPIPSAIAIAEMK
jgi:hypothetical protein